MDFPATSAKNILNELDEARVADWKTQLTETLPPEFQGSLPSIEEIEAELSRDIALGGKS